MRLVVGNAIYINIGDTISEFVDWRPCDTHTAMTEFNNVAQ